MNRYQGNDGRPTGLMSIAFTIISVLGVVVFFAAGPGPSESCSPGSPAICIREFFASFRIGAVHSRHSSMGQDEGGLLQCVPGAGRRARVH